MTGQLRFCGTWVWAVLLVVSTARADNGPAVSDSEPKHPHRPIILEADPMIARLPLSLVRPRRLLVAPEGDLYVADWGAGTVLRLSPDGQLLAVYDGFDEPAGLALTPEGDLLVACHASGKPGGGVVVRLSSMGQRSLFADGLTGPTDLALDKRGTLYVACFEEGTIVRIDSSGMATPVADVPSPVALLFDNHGRLLAVSADEGTVLRVFANGRVSVIARGLTVPSDIAQTPRGRIVVTNLEGTTLSTLEPMGQLATFAAVPKGTVGIAFDPLGNLLLVNWDWQVLVKVTTHLSIPCPCCNQPVPLEIRPRRRTLIPDDAL